VPPLAALLVSLRGRISRSTFVVATALVLATFAVLMVFLESVVGRRSTLVLYPPLYGCLLALSVKRLHDDARSGAWLLVGLVPVLGVLWLFFELALSRGTVGSNQYGPDPREAGRDYMTVV